MTYEKAKAASGEGKGRTSEDDVVVYYCRTYVKAVRGRRVKRGDVCYGMLRAAACVDESDHHALMYVLSYYCGPVARGHLKNGGVLPL